VNGDFPSAGGRIRAGTRRRIASPRGSSLAAVLVALVTALIVGVVTWQLLSRLRAVGPDAPEGEQASSPQQPDDPLSLARAGQRTTGMRIPDFTLIDQNSNEKTRAIFEGRWTVLEFMFSHCVLACPVMTGNMTVLQDLLKGTDVRLVSISVDPVHDTPERLRRYAAEFGADPERWTFLTGDAATVERIVTEALGFALVEDADMQIDLPGGGKMANIIHPTRFFLVNPQGEVVMMFDGMNDEEVRELARVAARMAAANRPSRP